jgi:hypothetical protein
MDDESTRRRAPLLDARMIAKNLPHGSESTVRHWIATKQLASLKVGRRRLVRRDVAAAFLGVDPSALVA